MNYKVYKHENNINGKVYIGITGYENPNDRWKNGLGYKPYGKASASHLYHAINKYGWENFESTVLFYGLSYDQACTKEIEVISKYKATEHEFGYNKHSGGLAGVPLSEDAKAKISKANRGVRNGMYGIGDKHPMYGKTHTLEARRKISEAHMGREPWNKGKTGVISEEARRKISDAHKGNKYNLGKRHSQKTKDIISDKTKNNWKDENYRQKMVDAHKGNNCAGKAVICGETRFNSIKECAEHLGVHWKTLSRWLNGVRGIPVKHTHLNLRYENTEVN